MPGKTAGPPEGLRSQIDELDALLDRLLKLPLGPAPATTSAPALKLAQPGDSMLDVMDDALELDAPILRIPTHDDEAKTEVDETAPPLRPLPIESEFGTFPILSDEPASAADTSSPAILPLAEHAPINRLEDREIPWIDDEPGATETAVEKTTGRPLAPRAGALGPRVEIVQGALNTRTQSHMGGDEVPDEPRRPGVLRCLFIAWNWLFGLSVGLLLPGLMRPRGKRVLALLGLGLLGASAFLAWRWWMP